MNTQRGIVMIMVLIFLGVGGLTIAPTLAYAGAALKFARVSRESTWAKYAVDAVAQEALWKLQYDTSFQCDPAPTPAIKFSDCVASKSSWTLTTKALPAGTPYTLIPQVNGQDVSVRVEVPGVLTAVGPTPTPSTSEWRVCSTVTRDTDPTQPGDQTWVQVGQPITYTLTIWTCTTSGANRDLRRIKVLMPPSFQYTGPTTTTYSPTPGDLVPEVIACDAAVTAPTPDYYPCPQTTPVPITDGTIMANWPSGTDNYNPFKVPSPFTWTFKATPTTWGVFFVDVVLCYFPNNAGDPGTCDGTSVHEFHSGKQAPVVVGMFNIQGNGKGYAYGASSKLDNAGSDLISQQPK